MSPDPARIIALDVVRGCAVMGIVLLNIIDFGLPRCAATDPTCYRPNDADWWVWAANFVIAEGKMRGLFTLLFGASALLLLERSRSKGRSPGRAHYARMATLLAIGAVHGWLIWSGDILMLYAIAGMLLYPALRLPTRGLVAIAIILLGAQVISATLDYSAARRFQAAATAPDAAASTKAEWQRFEMAIRSSPAQITAEVEAQRGGWAEVLPLRFTRTKDAVLIGIPAILPETIALMLIGAALFRSGFFSGKWTQRRYLAVMAVGYGIAMPLYLPLVTWLDDAQFDPLTFTLANVLHLTFLRLPLALAHAAVVILLVRSRRGSPLIERIAAVGRTALSNYLGASVVCTFLFCGYGLGWFGRLQRWELYLIVPPIWAAMLICSAPWLRRFGQGPIEMLWRRSSDLLAR